MHAGKLHTHAKASIPNIVPERHHLATTDISVRMIPSHRDPQSRVASIFGFARPRELVFEGVRVNIAHLGALSEFPMGIGRIHAVLLGYPSRRGNVVGVGVQPVILNEVSIEGKLVAGARID